MNWTELLGALLGLVAVALVVTRSLWNYPFAIASVALFGFVFLEARLYSDALLQLFYVVVNGYGWWNWTRARGRTGEVPVATLATPARAAIVAGCVVASLGWGALMQRTTDAAHPWWDGTIAVVSIVAQILQSRRAWESWVLWILIDLLAIPLFIIKDLWMTAALYAVYLALSIGGLVAWLRARRG